MQSSFPDKPALPRAAFTSSALTRRDAGTWLLGLAATALLTGAAPPPGTLGAAEPFSWEKLVELARRTAKKPYVQPPVSPLAAKDFDTLARLTYGTAGSIEQVIRLFPTATAVAPYAVQVNVVEKGMARPVVDTSGLFVDGAKADPAGFRIMAEDGHADWLSFMGASYFRTSGSRDQFGLSARGIAIDTGLPSGEEFPNFTRFWIEHVETDHFMIHALLDGPSLSGAFAIDTRGGDGAGAVQDVMAVLFMRRDV